MIVAERIGGQLFVQPSTSGLREQAGELPVSWGDAARFCNWMHNGQKTGVEDSTTTESWIVRSQRRNRSAAGTHAQLPAVLALTWVLPTDK